MTPTTAAAQRRPLQWLVITLAVLAAARAALTFARDRSAWGLDLQRFLPPPWAWALWGIAAVVLLPPVSRWLAAPAGWLGGRTAHGRGGAVTWALLAAALVLAFPDQTHMTGDFILRERAIEEGRQPAIIFPQALPLDVMLHHTLPRLLFTKFGILANAVARVWGALDAAALALAAVALARALGLGGASALVLTGGIVFGGGLALFTGYGKGLADLVVLVAAIAALGAQVVARGRGWVGLGLAAAVAVALHRAGLVLLPAMLVAWGLGVRAHGVSRRAIAGLALPLAAAAIAAPHAIAIVRGFDVEHHLATGGGVRRWADLANALVLVAPLAPLVPVLAIAFGRAQPWRRALAPAAVLALALLGLAASIQPQQGIVRDWDVFAPAGMALAILAAWLAAEAVQRAAHGAAIAPVSGRVRTSLARTAQGLALAIVLAAAVPALQWLVHLANVPLGMARVRAVLVGPPQRSPLERARLWDFLGIRNAWLGDWYAAADAFAESATLLPTPRVLDQWARAEIHRGDWTRAREVYRRWTERAPDDLSAWRSYAATVTRMNDFDGARLAAQNIMRLNPGDVDAKEILRILNQQDSTAAAGK